MPNPPRGRSDREPHIASLLASCTGCLLKIDKEHPGLTKQVQGLGFMGCDRCPKLGQWAVLNSFCLGNVQQHDQREDWAKARVDGGGLSDKLLRSQSGCCHLLSFNMRQQGSPSRPMASRVGSTWYRLREGKIHLVVFPESTSPSMCGNLVNPDGDAEGRFLASQTESRHLHSFLNG